MSCFSRNLTSVTSEPQKLNVWCRVLGAPKCIFLERVGTLTLEGCARQREGGFLSLWCLDGHAEQCVCESVGPFVLSEILARGVDGARWSRRLYVVGRSGALIDALAGVEVMEFYFHG